MEHNENVVICPPCGENVGLPTKRGANKENLFLPLLPRLTAVLPPQGREMFRGFTLIELLVVVLIIGILAAVAVPQYQKAVLKARTVELISVLTAMQKAVDAWVLENGYKNAGPADFVLGVPLSNQLQKDYAIDWNCNNSSCLIGFLATPTGGPVDVVFNNSNYAWTKECYIWEDEGVAVCEQLKQSFPNMTFTDFR